MSFLKKRLVFIMAVLLLMGTVLAACSGGGSGAGDSKGSGTSASGESGGSPSGDSGGEGTSEEPLELTMLLSLFEEIPDMNNDFWVEFQKRTNTKLNIEWVPDGDYDTKLELVLASGDLPDVVFARNYNSPTIQTAIKNGAFWELGQFLGDFSEYPNLRDYSAPLGFRYVTRNGEIYGIPRNRPVIDEALKIRKDWLDKLGMDIPQTMDEFAEYLVAAVTQDPDGNGQHDTVGYVHPGGTGIPPSILAAFGGLEAQFDEDGGLIHRFLAPGYTRTVEYMRDLYAKGALPQEFSTIRPTQAQELFESGKAAAYQRNIWRAWSFEQNIKKVYPDAEVTVIAPQGPDGHHALRNTPGIFGVLMIAKSVPEEKVKRILDFFEYTNTPEFFDFIFFGIEGVHHNLVDGYPVMTEQGNIEVGTSAQQPIPLAFNNWWKSYDKAAPKEYNDKIWEMVQNWDELGYYDPSEYVVSDTWTNTWPNYQNEWESKVVEAIVGRITMDEYRAYVDSLNSRPEFKQAYQEFRQFYDEFWAD